MSKIFPPNAFTLDPNKGLPGSNEPREVLLPSLSKPFLCSLYNQALLISNPRPSLSPSIFIGKWLPWPSLSQSLGLGLCFLERGLEAEQLPGQLHSKLR